ncbi:MAG: hypothetical protein AB7G21_14250, partial [Dehalococcoidia bacterium]
MPDPHRIELETLDLEEAEALVAQAAQLRALLDDAPDEGHELLTAEVDRLEAEARPLRERPPHRGQWVDIKPRRSYGDRLAISAARVRDEVVADRMVRTIDPVAWTLTKLDRAIDGWAVDWWNGNLPGRQPAGMSEDRRAALAEIDEDLGPRLVAAIEAFYDGQKRSDADTKA